MRFAPIKLVPLLVALCAAPASAQEWPTRPVSIVVPFAAGGPVDVVARIMAPRMAELIGQQLIVDNIPGAGGMVGANRVAKGPPDGYAVLLGNQGTHTFSQFLYKRPLYNAVSDFAAAGLVVSNSKMLVVRKDLPATNLNEFAAYAKLNGGRMQYGSAGSGSATHIACMLLGAKIGAEMTHVPYRSTTHAMQDVIAGRIDVVCDVISTALPQIRAGTVKALATLGTARSAVLPDLPTALEQGFADVDAEGWNGFFFAKDTPASIVQRFNAATVQALALPSLRKQVADLGLFVPDDLSPGFHSALVARELAKWGPPIQAGGISAD
ncbi:MAG: Bug family tripartite tricarboxylate transporter substrate binding protein [Xanthobacteraceae bacterium]